MKQKDLLTSKNATITTTGKICDTVGGGGGSHTLRWGGGGLKSLV